MHNPNVILLTLWLTLVGLSLEVQAAMVAWYRMDETSGTDVLDATGNNHTAQLCDTSTCPSASGPGRTTGRWGGGLSWSTGDYVQGDTISPANITYCVWANSTASATTQNVVGTQADRTSLQFHRDSGPAFVVYTTTHFISEWTSNALSSTNTWHHLCGTYDGETARLFVNGIERVTDTTPTGSLGALSPTLLGVHPNMSSNRFQGTMDDVRIYDHALSAAEVNAVFIRGRASRR